MILSLLLAVAGAWCVRPAHTENIVASHRQDRSCEFPLRLDRFKAYQGHERIRPLMPVPHGATLRFHCEPVGTYILRGSRTSTCINGNWTEKPPFCYDPEPNSIIMELKHESHTGPGGIVYVEPYKEVELECRSARPVELVRNDQFIDGPYNDRSGLPALRATFKLTRNESTEIICRHIEEDSGQFRSITLVARYRYDCPMLNPATSALNIRRKNLEAYEFSCTPPSVLQGRKILHCLVYGEWENDIPTCVLPSFPAPYPENGFPVRVDSRKPSPPTQVVASHRQDRICKLPPRENGFKAYQGHERIRPPMFVPHGAKLRFHCEPVGTTILRGSRTSTCINGNWTEELPFCYGPEPNSIIMELKHESRTGPGGIVYVEPDKEVELECRSARPVQLVRNAHFIDGPYNDRSGQPALRATIKLTRNESTEIICRHIEEDSGRFRSITLVARSYRRRCTLTAVADGHFVRDRLNGATKQVETGNKLAHGTVVYLRCNTASAYKQVRCVNGTWQPHPACDGGTQPPSDGMFPGNLQPSHQALPVGKRIKEPVDGAVEHETGVENKSTAGNVNPTFIPEGERELGTTLVSSQGDQSSSSRCLSPDTCISTQEGANIQRNLNAPGNDGTNSFQQFTTSPEVPEHFPSGSTPAALKSVSQIVTPFNHGEPDVPTASPTAPPTDDEIVLDLKARTLESVSTASSIIYQPGEETYTEAPDTSTGFTDVGRARPEGKIDLEAPIHGGAPAPSALTTAQPAECVNATSTEVTVPTFSDPAEATTTQFLSIAPVPRIKGCANFETGPDGPAVEGRKNFYGFGDSITFSCPYGAELHPRIERMICLGDEWGWSERRLPTCIPVQDELAAK